MNLADIFKWNDNKMLLKKMVVLEELLVKFETVCGFDLKEFLELYISGYVKIDSEIDLKALKSSVKSVGCMELIQVLNEQKTANSKGNKTESFIKLLETRVNKKQNIISKKDASDYFQHYRAGLKDNK